MEEFRSVLRWRTGRTGDSNRPGDRNSYQGGPPAGEHCPAGDDHLRCGRKGAVLCPFDGGGAGGWEAESWQPSDSHRGGGGGHRLLWHSAENLPRHPPGAEGRHPPEGGGPGGCAPAGGAGDSAGVHRKGGDIYRGAGGDDDSPL